MGCCRGCCFPFASLHSTALYPHTHILKLSLRPDASKTLCSSSQRNHSLRSPLSTRLPVFSRSQFPWLFYTGTKRKLENLWSYLIFLAGLQLRTCLSNLCEWPKGKGKNTQNIAGVYLGFQE